MNNVKTTSRLFVVTTFAIAMAWVESAVVYYLRTMVDRIQPHQPNPLPLIGGMGPVELVREAATLVMLLMVGILAGRTWRTRLAYSAIAFGIWDIFYYVFLRVMCGWPNSLLDWDILFLLPLPWWGPVLAPILIALLMIVWGMLVCTREDSPSDATAQGVYWALSFVGMVVALFVFMSGTLQVAGKGTEAVRNVVPTQFQWPLFSLALCGMAAPVVRLLWLRLPIRGSQERALPPNRAANISFPPLQSSPE
jgi:hypothetical protein